MQFALRGRVNCETGDCPKVIRFVLVWDSEGGAAMRHAAPAVKNSPVVTIIRATLDRMPATASLPWIALLLETGRAHGPFSGMRYGGLSALSLSPFSEASIGSLAAEHDAGCAKHPQTHMQTLCRALPQTTAKEYAGVGFPPGCGQVRTADVGDFLYDGVLFCKIPGGFGLKSASHFTERGVGKGAVIVVIIIILIVLEVVLKLFSNPAPTIKPAEAIQGIGLSRTVNFIIHDARYRITRVEVAVVQGFHTFPAPVTVKNVSPTATRGSKGMTVEASAQIGRREMPQLQQGRATIRVVAVNNSWGRFSRGGRRVFTMNVPVRFMPPQVEVLSPQQYVNLGGCDMVIFTVSAGTVRSGVQVGEYYFPSWPVKETQQQTRLALFAFPYDIDPNTPAHIVAEDDAGNRTVATFNYKVFPEKFPNTKLAITDAYMQRVVPPILSQTTAIRDQGSLVQNYIEINRDLRRIDKQTLVQFSKQTNPKFMWREAFLRLPNTKAEANFADHRTYVYDGKVIDHEVHLGDDLASVAHSTVTAANDGLVIYAGWFDIFGNAVVIDHGCGLQTLYGHMASFKVKPGDLVKRGQALGYSDSTGLAGGDHVHFAVLLDGIPVNPKEWWDPHWIHDHITGKLQQYGQ